MIIGNTGTGKTTILNITIKALNDLNDNIILYKLNPKSITRKELFGYNDHITNSFIPGIVSKIIIPVLDN